MALGVQMNNSDLDQLDTIYSLHVYDPPHPITSEEMRQRLILFGHPVDDVVR